MFRVHFTDDYGQGSFDVDGSWTDAENARKELNEDSEHCAWDIWIEDLDDPTADY